MLVVLENVDECRSVFLRSLVLLESGDPRPESKHEVYLAIYNHYSKVDKETRNITLKCTKCKFNFMKLCHKEIGCKTSF
jgi:hypothetical protein